jgi:hypothetical protein
MMETTAETLEKLKKQIEHTTKLTELLKMYYGPGPDYMNHNEIQLWRDDLLIEIQKTERNLNAQPNEINTPARNTTMEKTPGTELVAKYENDFSTDKAYGQLSVVDIIGESVAELITFIPEIRALPKQRQEEIEEKIMLFALGIYDSHDEIEVMSEEEYETK